MKNAIDLALENQSAAPAPSDEGSVVVDAAAPAVEVEHNWPGLDCSRLIELDEPVYLPPDYLDIGYHFVAENGAKCLRPEFVGPYAQIMAGLLAEMKQSDFNALLRELRRSKKRSLPFEARLTAAAEMLPKSMALVSRKKAPALLISFINENLEHIHDDDDWYAFLRFLEAIGGFLSIRPATDAVPPAESDHK